MTIDCKAIGPRIRENRDAAGLSLNALAEKSGVSKGYLSQLENGEASNPSIETLGKIADALGVSLHSLVDEKPKAPTLPRGLAELVEQRQATGNPLPPEDVDMLRGISFRGRRPKSADDFAFLYETITRTIR